MVSCSTSKSINSKLLKINEGMSKKEIVSLLGDPNDRRFEGGYEEWEYRLYTNPFDNQWKFCIITFKGDFVTGMQTYTNHLPEPAPYPIIP